ncbi:MAG: PilZ domain-containing protein [Pyrinomonadaceae bacterium]
MQEKRLGSRYVISFPVRLKWKDEEGNEIVQDGLTENVGPHGTLVFLPRVLPPVGSKLSLTVTENADDEVNVTVQVIRVVRNAGHPQAALQLIDSKRVWQKKVWEYAADILANQKPEEWDDWN